jgi:choline dehydrogenase
MSTYDYVVVGAGSAGCVLANRLSADPATRVLLLEAGGPDTGPLFRVPGMYGKPFRTAHDWGYDTTPQRHLDDRPLYWPRGKVLGGSSSLNAMIYIRGHRADYDEWAALGCTGWGYDDVLPYFRRSEDNRRIRDRYHGTGGELTVSDLRDPHPYSLRYVEACVAMGMERNPDFNGERLEGTGLYQVTQRNGVRVSAAAAFLRPALARPNLTVRTYAHTRRVRIEAGRAVGVVYEHRHVEQEAHADGEVILAAGAIGTPQLLMLSGVGPAPHLREHGIGVAADLPGVGENLQDHLAIGTGFLTRDGRSLLAAERLRHLLDYAIRKRGWLTSNVGEAGAFYCSRPDLDAPDLQDHFIPAAVADHGLSEPVGHGFLVAPTLVRVESRGTIRLRSANPTWAPAIEPNYLDREADSEALLIGLKRSREVGLQPAFHAVRSSEYLPGAEATSDDALRAHLRRWAQTLYHPVGTAKMGIDDRSVVDPQLRVREVEALRVADASVMPVLVRGNTNAAAIMIGEKAADLVLGRTAVRGDDRVPAAAG